MPSREEGPREAQVQEQVVDVASRQVVEGTLDVCYMANKGRRCPSLGLDECLQQHPDFLCFSTRQEAEGSSIKLTTYGAKCCSCPCARPGPVGCRKDNDGPVLCDCFSFGHLGNWMRKALKELLRPIRSCFNVLQELKELGV